MAFVRSLQLSLCGSISLSQQAKECSHSFYHLLHGWNQGLTLTKPYFKRRFPNLPTEKQCQKEQVNSIFKWKKEFEFEICWCSPAPFSAKMQFILWKRNSVTLEHLAQEQWSQSAVPDASCSICVRVDLDNFHFCLNVLFHPPERISSFSRTWTLSQSDTYFLKVEGR